MSGLQTQREALLPYSTHRGVAKFVLSAQLNPAHIDKSFILYGEGKLASVRNPSVADPGCLSLDPNFSIPDPGSASKNFSIFSPKNCF
jgi:hypothetical protein